MIIKNQMGTHVSEYKDDFIINAVESQELNSNIYQIVGRNYEDTTEALAEYIMPEEASAALQAVMERMAGFFSDFDFSKYPDTARQQMMQAQREQMMKEEKEEPIEGEVVA